MQYVDRVRRQHAGGGLMLLFDKKFDCRETEIQENVLANLQDTEALVVVLDDIVYLVAYIPPKIKININDLSTLLMMNNRVIIGRDLNAKHPSWGNKCTNQNGRIM
ncbi:hypothetical protein PV325_006705, partial [Microctonus aethiopoides]